MTIERVSTGTKGTGSSSLTVGEPGSTATGDVLLCFVIGKCTVSTSPEATMTGWTKVKEHHYKRQIYMAIFSYVLGSTPSFSVTGLNSCTNSSGVAVAYRGVDNTTPVNIVHPTGTGGNSSTATIPPITTTVVNTMVIAPVGTVAANATVGAISGTTPTLTEFYEDYGGTSPPNNYIMYLSISDGLYTSSGFTGTRTATLAASSYYVTIPLALNPAPDSQSPSSNAYFGGGPAMFRSPTDLFNILKKPIWSQTSYSRNFI